MGDPTTAATIEPAAATPRQARPGLPHWARWAIPACLLLGLAGAARNRTNDHFEAFTAAQIRPPFPMKSISKDLGQWTVVEESDSLLDPKIVQVAGCSDYLVRSYYYKPTGVRVTALVLYGPSHLVVPHTPEVCYPVTGYVRYAGPTASPIDRGKSSPAEFRSLVFGMPGAAGAPPRLEEVYFSYRVNERWVPAIPSARSSRGRPRPSSRSRSRGRSRRPSCWTWPTRPRTSSSPCWRTSRRGWPTPGGTAGRTARR